MTVIGTRPEVVKMAPVIKELNNYSEKFESAVCTTARHWKMLNQVRDIFAITPEYDLNLMQPDQSLAQITARMLTALDEVIAKERPN